MRALIVKPRFLERILSGEKTWELRGSRTNVRGTIGLIPSGSGAIVATAQIVDCRELDRSSFEANRGKHRSSASFDEQGYERVFAWELRDVRALPAPVPYEHPRGAIVWVRVPDAVQRTLGTGS